MSEQTNTTIICCEECGCCDEELFVVDGRHLCRDCLHDSGYEQCEDCGEWIDADDACITHNDEIYCDACARARYLEACDICDRYSSDISSVFGRYRTRVTYCRNCLDEALIQDDVFYCEDCEEYFQSDHHDRYTTASGTVICDDCYNNFYHTCAGCGEIYPDNELTYCSADGEYYCEDCAEDHVDSSHGEIREYSYKPSPIFHGLSHSGSAQYGDPITMGFELEVDKGENRNRCSCEIDEEFGDAVYMKNDGSVDFEIVTHPRTLESYLKDFDFEKLCNIPLEYGYKSHDAGTCGFHIHVGRAQLGPTEAIRQAVIAKIALLMYRHWNALVVFSRRKESQLNQWAAAPNFNFRRGFAYTETVLTHEVHSYYNGCSRYQSLNLQNRGTIEFRLWRGSLKPYTLKATLQLTSNIVLFAMNHSMYDVVNSSWEDIVNYESYPELEMYNKEHDLESYSVTQDIPFCNCEAKEDNDVTEVDGIRVGTRVKIVNAIGSLVSDLMLNVTGTVVRIRHNPIGPIECAIHVDPGFAGFVYRNCHTANGDCPDGEGYFAYPENLEILDADARAASF